MIIFLYYFDKASIIIFSKICNLEKKIKLLNMSFYYLKTLVIKFYWFFSYFFIHLMNLKFIHNFLLIHYKCFHISKSYNFNTKLYYIFNNMKHQALVTLAMVCVTMITLDS